MDSIVIYKREEFRKWLDKNHKKESRVAVILYKKHTGKPAPTHRELIEEAICYGWIDTTVKRLDEERFMRRFSKRTKNSTWSNNTLGYAKDLAEKGKMTEEGMKFYELGLKKPVHDDGIAKNPDMPPELEKALLKDKLANKNFQSFPPSVRKMLYRWILSGKLSETRKRRH